MHDTLKKPREILMASYAVRYPELAAKTKSIGGELDMDPQIVEQDRQHLLAIERLILETICFNFTSKMSFPYVIKAGKAFGATKTLTKLAWRLAIDSYRTLVNLSYPPHVVALACLLAAALLSSFEQGTIPAQPGLHTPHEIVATLGQHGEWEKQFQTRIEDLEEIAHNLIDLLIQGAQNPVNASPRTPSSPHPARSATAANPPTLPPLTPYKPDQLMRLKIVMRESEHASRPRESMGLGEARAEAEASLLGRNEGTVRFLFAPPGMVGEVS